MNGSRETREGEAEKNKPDKRGNSGLRVKVARSQKWIFFFFFFFVVRKNTVFILRTKQRVWSAHA